ncbi:MAG: ABC transporter permease [Candidatus Marinimicrobia bacterium]|nr:ABC transporter permease [Candidatus Neomarinimicrobiota bacterium]
MKISSFIAKRHLFSRHKVGYISFISIISTVGLAIGVAALILTISVLNGFEKELKGKLINFDSHVRLRLLYKDSMDSTHTVYQKLDSIKAIQTIVPYIHRNVIIRKGKNTDGVIVEGIRNKDIKKTLNISRFLVKGQVELKTKEGSNGILMGRKLANYLEADIGDQVYLFNIKQKSSFSSSPKIGKFTLNGIYHSGIAEYDDIFVYTNLEACQDLFDMNNFSGFQMNVTDPDNASQIAAKINEELGFPYHAFSWDDLHKNLFKWLKVQRFPIILVFGLIALVALFNLVSALTMIVIEKTKDIGVLKSLGLNRTQIISIFVQESVLIGLGGVLLGFGLALFLAWLQNSYGIISIPEDVYFMKNVPILLRIKDFIIIGGAALICSLLTTIYPAYKASSVFPGEVMHYE